jgi:diguanylate cyclase (GGDEF)-like protein/PAS domain S-box-containing protein
VRSSGADDTEVSEDLGGVDASGRMDDEAIARVAAALLDQSPGAYIAAMNDRGLFVPMPAAVPPSGHPLSGHPLIEGHASGLELVVQDDIRTVIDMWKRALTVGAAMVDVHPLDDPQSHLRIHFLDTRAQYGVLLCVAVYPDGVSISPSRGVGDLLRPRVSIVRKTQTAEFTEVDGAFELILGHAATEIISRRNLEFVHPDDQPRAIANWMDLLAHPGASRRVRLRQRHHDGHWIWFEITNHNRLNDPAERCVVAEMIDISEEMAAQEFLHAREQLLRRLTEALPVGVLQIDATGAVVHRNARLTDMIGGAEAQTMITVFDRVFAPDRAALESGIRAALERSLDTDLEVGIESARGEVARCRVSVRALSDDDGRPTGAIVCVDDVTEGARLRAQLEERATYDALTRCRNRASIIAELDRALDALRGVRSGIAVVFIDLDGFKRVNDLRGHAEGDALLVKIAQALTDSLRREDLVGRLGGDEFLVLGHNIASAEEALAMGDRLAASLAHCADPDTQRPVASIGVAWTPTGLGVNADLIVSHADTAMYASKREGAGRPVLHVGQLLPTPAAPTPG